MMSIATIRIQVDNTAAQAFEATPVEKREQLLRLIGYLIEHFAQSTPASLLALMDEVSQEAAGHGLTPAQLEALLSDE